MNLRPALLSALSAACLASPALGLPTGDQEPHRSLVIGGDCRECTFEGANLAGAQFLGGDFTGANFEGAELLGARLIDLNLGAANLQGASLIEVHVANSGLEGANLRDARLNRARFHQVRMIGANLADTELRETVMLIVDLTGADLHDTDARAAIFRQSNFTGVMARDGQFSNAHFITARLTGMDARGANFSGSIFENVDLTRADLRDANFQGAHLRAVNLTAADLRGADGLDSANFSQVCGVNVVGLPDGVSLSQCAESSGPSEEDRIRMAVASNREALAAAREHRRVQIAVARNAFEQAMGDIELRVGQNDRVRLEAIAAAREGWEAAAEALAEAELELIEEAGELNWTFEIRRAELGEPIRVILEQATPEEVVVLTPRGSFRAPAPPPSPPAPDMPRRVDTPRDGEDGRLRFERETEARERGYVTEAEARIRAEVTEEIRELEFVAAEVEAEAGTEAGTGNAEAREAALSAADIAFLIEATASDFSNRPNANFLRFRDVQAGVWPQADGSDRPLLCGEVELTADDKGEAFQPFATVRSDGFELLIGEAGQAICADDRVIIQPSADLAIRIERRLSRGEE